MNPFLGYRALRISISETGNQMFRTQLRALLRASVHGKLRIMFPMVALLTEFRTAKGILEEEKANGTEIEDAAIQGVKIGMMGPLAGIGDPVFWFTIRPILGALVHHWHKLVTSLVHLSSSSVGTLSVWPSCGTLKNLVTKQVQKSLKTCLVVS